MNKEFIPYEQALELKELGFNDVCLGYHNIDPYLPKPTFNLVKPFDHEWCLPAPLYQQAFRWFREKHGLDNAVLKDRFVIETEDMLPYWFYGFKTYEEAELTCLIKLIEIVKQK
jgi:hypothetical protein